MVENAPPADSEEKEKHHAEGEVRAPGGDHGRCRGGADGRDHRTGAHRRADRRDQGGVDLRRAAQRRRLVAGPRQRTPLRPEEARQERDHDVQGERPGGAADLPGDRQPRPRRQQDHLRHVLRLHGRDGGRREEVPGRLLRARDRLQERQELRQLLRRGRGLDLPVRHGGGRGDEEGRHRLRRPVSDPRGDPARERLCAGSAGCAPGGEGQARLDEVVVRPGEGEEGGREPRRRRRGRDRPERRQPGGRPVRPVEGAAVGRLRQRREEVRPDVVAHGGGVRLGPLLPQAGEGGGERHLEDRQLLREHRRRAHGHRPVRPEGVGRRRRPRSRRSGRSWSRGRSTSSRGRSTTRAASCACRRASG